MTITKEQIKVLTDKLATDIFSLVNTTTPVPVPIPTPTPTPPNTGVQSKTDFLNRFLHLTLPVDKSGKAEGNDAAEISRADLIAGYTSQWFKQDAKSITFITPDNAKGAFTSTAKYVRTELRGNDLDFSKDQESTIRLVPEKVPAGLKVVVHQIHDAEEPWVKIVFKDGLLYALVKNKAGGDDLPAINLMDGIKPTDIVESTIKWIAAKKELQLWINDSMVSKVTIQRNATKAYFKAGNYLQSNAGKGLQAVIKHVF